jgi:hypothetical protein
MTPRQRQLLLRIQERGAMEAFAKTLIKQFRSNIDKLNIGESGAGRASFRYKLFFDSDRHVSKIRVHHLDYLTYVDIGLGKGVSVSDIGSQRIGRTLLGRKIGERRAKRWYYKKIYGQTIALAVYVMEVRGDHARVMLREWMDEIPDAKVNL